MRWLEKIVQNLAETSSAMVTDMENMNRSIVFPAIREFPYPEAIGIILLLILLLLITVLHLVLRGILSIFSGIMNGWQYIIRKLNV